MVNHLQLCSQSDSASLREELYLILTSHMTGLFQQGYWRQAKRQCRADKAIAQEMIDQFHMLHGFRLMRETCDCLKQIYRELNDPDQALERARDLAENTNDPDNLLILAECLWNTGMVASGQPEGMYLQTPLPRKAWHTPEPVCPEIRFLQEQKLLHWDPQQGFGAQLWGTWQSAAPDAVVVLDGVETGSTGEIRGVEFHFVAAEEFVLTYDIL